MRSNKTHQADPVGPCHLKGPVRSYSLNVIDTATVRCGLYPSMSKSSQSIIDGLWAIWMRMGVSNDIQIDNAMASSAAQRIPVYGPPPSAVPASWYRTWFIPMAEPWRNGMIEKFNDCYQKMFLGKNVMTMKNKSSGFSGF